ncbi:MAG: topoisomerase IV, partial [Clostridia bacterium]|nr:topoisomerase IV [Clostridia bacterium]
KNIIMKELEGIAEKYGQPRKSMIIDADHIVEEEIEEEIPDYAVHLFFTKEGYFKKITPQSLRMSGEHKLKEGDEVIQHFETTNHTDLIFFSDKQQAYKAKAPDFSDTKTSVLGEYIPSRLSFDEGENALYMVPTKDYKGFVFFVFESGKIAKVPLNSYATKTNRKRLTGAYTDKEKLAAIVYTPDDDCDLILTSSSGRILVFHSSDLLAKTSRSTLGVAVMKLKKGHRVISAQILTKELLHSPEHYRAKTLPASGQLPRPDESGEQLSL